MAITSDSLENVKKQADHHSYSFELLADPEGRVTRSYGVLWDEAAGHNEPGVFIVLSDGSLTFLGVTSGPWGRPAVEDVLTMVRGRWEKIREKAASPTVGRTT